MHVCLLSVSWKIHEMAGDSWWTQTLMHDLFLWTGNGKKKDQLMDQKLYEYYIQSSVIPDNFLRKQKLWKWANIIFTVFRRFGDSKTLTDVSWFLCIVKPHLFDLAWRLIKFIVSRSGKMSLLIKMNFFHKQNVVLVKWKIVLSFWNPKSSHFELYQNIYQLIWIKAEKGTTFHTASLNLTKLLYHI